ncbi:hypothetical protein HHK36_012904 [Tetracentron sinense]|uniref:Embryo sac development arrest 6 n=1 Tax=Tetracentron sinense TaxID=13715 RepID=A0A835DG04_TETSI|nr:hypothetical protein HHK36_012904 [Tetracentron sinense]
MSNHPRRVLTPWASRKRKEREGFDTPKPSTPTTSPKAAEPFSSNGLLAGYLAHEFLSQGTLFGQKWDPARAEAVPLSAAEPKRVNLSQREKAEPSTRGTPSLVKNHSYTEVASLLKTNGAHIPGVVNPTQLARWLQM